MLQLFSQLKTIFKVTLFQCDADLHYRPVLDSSSSCRRADGMGRRSWPHYPDTVLSATPHPLHRTPSRTTTRSTEVDCLPLVLDCSSHESLDARSWRLSSALRRQLQLLVVIYSLLFTYCIDCEIDLGLHFTLVFPASSCSATL